MLRACPKVTKTRKINAKTDIIGAGGGGRSYNWV